MNKYKTLLLLLTGLVISGCANMNYSSKLTNVSEGILTGNVKASLDLLEESAGGPDKPAAADAANTTKDGDKPRADAGKEKTDSRKDLLFQMEAGQLRRLNGNIAASTASWLQADGFVKAWEEEFKSDPSKIFGDLGSVTINDTLRRYEGRDYEKVMLSLGLAMNHVALNDWEKARIEIRKMHERQALIAEYQAKVIEKAKEEAAGKDLKVTSFKELGGYPIETLEDPEVQRLKNSYESAYGHYLAGFIYEAIGEPSMAAPGYRKAAEMLPNVPLLEAALRDLDKRTAPTVAPTPPRGSGKGKGKPGAKPVASPSPVAQNEPGVPMVDTLIVAEMGLAPAVETQKIALLLPIPTRNGIRPQMVALSWPVVRPVTPSYPTNIRIDNDDIPLTFMTSVNSMARRALYDEMPAIMARTSIRAITKVAAQQAVDESTSRAGAALGPFGGLISLATKVAVAATEVADERIWRTLPDSYYIARVKLPAGKHTLRVNVGGVPKELELNVSGRYAIASLRVVGSQVYALTPSATVKAPMANGAATQSTSIASNNPPSGK